MCTPKSFQLVLNLIMGFSARLRHNDQGGITSKIRDVEKLFYERVKRFILFTVEKQ